MGKHTTDKHLAISALVVKHQLTAIEVRYLTENWGNIPDVEQWLHMRSLCQQWQAARRKAEAARVIVCCFERKQEAGHVSK